MTRRWLNADQFPGLAALAHAALGRLPTLAGSNRGRAPAPLVWMALLSHLRWGKRGRSVWPSNARLAALTGLCVRQVQYGLAWLIRAGRVEKLWRPRRGQCGPGRVLRLVIGRGPAPRVVLPNPARMAEIWRRCRLLRERAVSLVALAVAAHVHAAAEFGAVGRGKGCSATSGDLARFVGAQRGGTFSKRMQALEDAGIVRRERRAWAARVTVAGRLCVGRLRELAEEAKAMLAPAFARSKVQPPRGHAREADQANPQACRHDQSPAQRPHGRLLCARPSQPPLR